jgi:flavin reductase (DIM6/NTAB) family NADH-FMN oxidoreductase RutF
MKAMLEQIAFGAAPLSAHVTVGLADPGRVTRVVLEGLDAPLDVSRDHVPVSLRPFTIGLCLYASISESTLRAARLTLALSDWSEPHLVRGRLALRVQEAIDLPDPQRRLWIFEVLGSQNYCLGTPHMLAREARDWYYAKKKKKNPYNFRMSTAGLRALNVYYMRPRPVSLVTVMDGGESDVFPMDLIGPLSSGNFTMALRSTSPAIRLMENSRRIAVSALPAAFKRAAYALGTHHKTLCVEWNALPFATVTSMEFALPVPRDALLVRELEVHAVHRIHSHTFFVTNVARETCSASGDAFCHIAGPYAHVLGLESLP